MKNKKMKWVVFVILLTMMVPTYLYGRMMMTMNMKVNMNMKSMIEKVMTIDIVRKTINMRMNILSRNLQPSPVETVPSATWNVWSRTLDTEKGELPFDISKTVKIENQDGKQMDGYVIPNRGEMMIPAVKTAELIGATVKYYKTMEIAEMQLDANELIVKSGSNAVYENDTKTPMPAEAMMYQDELYIPISVLTNGLGLTVTWDETKQTFLIQQ